MIEKWKNINDVYQISNYGRFKSLSSDKVDSRGRTSNKKEKILKPWLVGKTCKYYIVNYYNNNERINMLIHRLVGIYFIPNPRNLSQINHKDGNPLNNHHTNLEWVSNMENQCHSYKTRKTTSQYTGVSLFKRDGTWASRISFKGIIKHLGYFNTEEEAYQARCNFEKKNNIINNYL